MIVPRPLGQSFLRCVYLRCTFLKDSRFLRIELRHANANASAKSQLAQTSAQYTMLYFLRMLLFFPKVYGFLFLKAKEKHIDNKEPELRFLTRGSP